MSLSPFDSFQSRFVTYLLTRPRIKSATIFHQNICGLRENTDELTSSMFPNFPHILRFSEHHLRKFELDQINVDGCRLGAAHCRPVVYRGGWFGGFKPPRNSEDIGGVLDRMSKKNQRLTFLL